MLTWRGAWSQETPCADCKQSGKILRLATMLALSAARMKLHIALLRTPEAGLQLQALCLRSLGRIIALTPALSAEHSQLIMAALRSDSEVTGFAHPETPQHQLGHTIVAAKVSTAAAMLGLC